MLRRVVRRLPPLVVGLGLLPGCRTDVGVAGRGPELDLDVAAARHNAATPSPPRPVETPPPKGNLGERLKIPSELPGADAAPVDLPRTESKAERDKAIDAVFGELPPLPPDPVPSAPPLSLDMLQREASLHHPVIRQAVAAVEAARGAAVQAGLPPNPSFGFEADTVGSGGTAGQQGAKLEQVIKTAGKLQLAQSAALIDATNAEVALRKARLDLATQVRTAYYGVLVAQEQLRVAHVASRFTDEPFRVLVEQLKGGEVAPYAPLQLRANDAQARAALAQAHLRYRAAWRQLAAAVGRPDLPCAPLAGSAAGPVPEMPYEVVRDRMLERHTDLTTAYNGVLKAQYQLRLARVTPVPDVALKLVVQKDYTTPPFNTTANVEVGVPIPVWDRNQGHVRQTEAELARAIEEAGRVRLDLLGRLAEATERYSANRMLVETYRAQVLPDLVRAYRGVVVRHQQEPNQVAFDDVLLAQQNLTAALTTYMGYLAAQWTAVVDLAGLAQCEDLAEFAVPTCAPPTHLP